MSNIIILLSDNKHKRANKNTCLLRGFKKLGKCRHLVEKQEKGRRRGGPCVATGLFYYAYKQLKNNIFFKDISF